MYERKVILIKEYDKSFTQKGKTLGGVVTLLCNGNTTKVSLNVVNADKMRVGEWTAHILADGKLFSYALVSEKELPINSIGRVSLVLTAGKNDVTVGYANTFGGKPDSALIAARNAKYNIADSAANKAAAESVKEPSAGITFGHSQTAETEYEKFISATENYYEKAASNTSIWNKQVEKNKTVEQNAIIHFEKNKERLGKTSESYADEQMKAERASANAESEPLESAEVKSYSLAANAVGEYADALEKYGGDGCYYLALKKEIAELFENFPVCMDLTTGVKNSVWAKIKGKNDKFFAFGVLTRGDEPVYICYALPSAQREQVSRAEFLNIGEGYYVIAQDAKTGKMLAHKAILSDGV